MSIPVAMLAGVDHVLRDAAVGGLLLDAPTLVAVRHEVDGRTARLRRVVVDAFGVVEDGWHPFEGHCATCDVREDAVRTLASLRDSGRWPAMVYCPPTGSTTLPFCTAFDAEATPSGRLDGLHVAAVATVADLSCIEQDVMGDNLLIERGLALSDDDRRSVGEVLAALLGHADLVVADGHAPRASALLDHLRAHDAGRLDDVGSLAVADLLAVRHRCRAAARRIDPRFVRASGRSERDSVWTLDLHSDRPFHPARLLQNIEALGGSRIRSRGRFWVPDRPGDVCAWDGAGAQLSIGAVGGWDGCSRSTRLVFTGTADERPALVAAFEDALATPQELSRESAAWAGASEVLAPWL
jgi:G3E family GTPase